MNKDYDMSQALTYSVLEVTNEVLVVWKSLLGATGYKTLIPVKMAYADQIYKTILISDNCILGLT